MICGSWVGSPSLSFVAFIMHLVGSHGNAPHSSFCFFLVCLLVPVRLLLRALAQSAPTPSTLTPPTTPPQDFDCNYGAMHVPIDKWLGTYAGHKDDVKKIWGKKKAGEEANETPVHDASASNSKVE